MTNGIELPGAGVLAIIMQAPADVMGKMSRDVSEITGVLSSKVMAITAELSKPPVMPTGFPGLPEFPGGGARVLPPERKATVEYTLPYTPPERKSVVIPIER